jgi:hypothetical protein
MFYSFVFIALSVLIVFFGVLIASAQAYLDPGTGSYLLQILAAGVLSALFMLKTYWHKIKSLFGWKKSEEDTPASGSSEVSDDSSTLDN